MDRHIRDYYSQSRHETPHGSFHAVMALHDTKQPITWESIHEKAPTLTRGWYELSQLSLQDRMEFIRDFWMSKLPYHPRFPQFITSFFSSLNDIGIYITQQKFDDPFQPHLVYSLSRDRGFFQGEPPATDEQIEALHAAFPDFVFPEDYCAFLQIHNGFSKTTDTTGIVPSTTMPQFYGTFQELLAGAGRITTTKDVEVDPKRLIPFYESFGMPFFQCFWDEWYPEQEAGNVYYSSQAKTISDVQNGTWGAETMAFPTFLDWLLFYMEEIL